MSYGGSHPQMSNNPPQPPPYDECIKTAASMQAIHMSNMDPSAGYGYVHYDYRAHLPPQQQLQQQQQQQQIHQRQVSLPASTVSSSMNGSLQQQAMSYNALAVNTAYQSSLSPPQFALSPPASYAGSPPQQTLVQNGVTSPSKSGSRPNLPTSPTHIAAMRAAAHQRSGGFDFPDTMMSYNRGSNANVPQYYQQQYPTPPHSNLDPSPSQHHHGLHPPEAYLTPSPESPGQWSSASPHSTSDWSEGMSSPPNPNSGMSFIPPSHAKHTEGVYI